MTAEEILVRAAEMIEAPGGWCQGVSWTEDGARCMHWAIEQASSGATLEAAATAYDAVTAELGLPVGSIQSITKWNDSEHRTAIEVATVLRNAKRNIVVPA